MSTIPHTKDEEKSYNPLNKAGLWCVGLTEFQDVFQAFIVLLIGSRMSEILATSLHSGWDEGRMEDALSRKTFLDNKRNPEEKSVTNANL